MCSSTSTSRTWAGSGGSTSPCVALSRRQPWPLSLNPLAPPQFHALLSDPRHYADVSIPHLSHVPTELLAFLPSVLCGTRHLSLRSFPSAKLSVLLPACSSRLTTLDLSFSGVRDDDLLALVRPGGRDQLAAGDRGTSVLHNLRALRLKGCRRLTAFLALLRGDNDDPPFPSLETLDLSWSSLSALPLPLSAHLPRLEDLNLSTTPYLALPHLVDALASLPPRLGALDLSHLGLRARDLRDLGAGETALRGTGDRGALRLVLAGNDSLTHQSLATLQRHWAAPHSRWGGRARVEVEHSPVLLESDDEDDVRRFVELVAGVVMRGGGGGGGQGEAAVVRSGGRGTR